MLRHQGMAQHLESAEAMNPAASDLNVRFRLVARYPDVLQDLSVAHPPLEKFVTQGEAPELSRIANDELAELVNKYPDKFIAAVACLPMNNSEAQ